MWHWLFDCLADAILQEHLHSLQFNFVAQLCSRDFLLGLFTPQPHALSNAQSSGGPQTLWLTDQSLTTVPQGYRLYPPQTWNVMLELDLSSLPHKITEPTFWYKSVILDVGLITWESCASALDYKHSIWVYNHWQQFIIRKDDGVVPTLASRFFIGHCWSTDRSAIGGDTPAVSSVAVTLNLNNTACKGQVSTRKLINRSFQAGVQN